MNAPFPKAALVGLTPHRDPLSQARIDLAMAEADLNGFVGRLAIGLLPETDARELARTLRDRVYAARERLDLVRFDLLEVVRVNGTALTGNDADDLGDALLTAIERVEDGRWHERHERPRAVTLHGGETLGAAQLGIVARA